MALGPAPDDLPRLARCVSAFEERYPESDSRGRLPPQRWTKGVERRFAGARSARPSWPAWSPPGWPLTTTWVSTRSLCPGRQPRARRRPSVGTPFNVAPVAPALLAGRRQAAHWPHARVDGQGRRDPQSRSERPGQTSPRSSAPSRSSCPTWPADPRGRAGPAKKPSRTLGWTEVRAEAPASADEPEARFAGGQAFLREFPGHTHRAEADALLAPQGAGRLADRQPGASGARRPGPLRAGSRTRTSPT